MVKSFEEKTNPEVVPDCTGEKITKFIKKKKDNINKKNTLVLKIVLE